MDETPKEYIGDYELLELIGDGAQGRVYKARRVAAPTDTSEEFVALKVVRISGEDETLRLKFQEQADILRRLSHNHIVAYRDCFSWHAGEWDEAQCLVMELLEGETLQERLKNSVSGLPWPQVEQIFEQCLAGLIHARERGITHRDIKPSNIFLNRNGQVKLIDFDIARCDDSGQMSTAGCKGTFDYMAPDFITINGFRGDETSDVFSLGICFYQALTGTLPYEALGDNAHIGYLNRWRDNAAPAPSFRPGVFRVLANAKAVVSRAIAARREQRYVSFAAFLEEFRKIRYRRIRHKNKEEYELLAVLGRGGFGEVFKARRVSDGLLVAVKFLFSEKQSSRFLKEAKILQQYPHPNLVQYVDFITIEGTAGEKQFFLVMEFLEGMPGWTLRPRLKHEGKLDISEAITLFSGYLSALQFLHSSAKPIIHRDIKPGNLYAPVGQPEKGKIFDLGVARDVSGTVTVGGVPGTLDYMAPEFAESGGDRGSPQSDLYALGLCLYESLAGKPVFERLPGDLNSAWLGFQDRLRKPLSVAFDAEAFVLHPRLKQVILTALALRPEDRFHSADEMCRAMQSALLPETAIPLPDHDDGFDAGEGVTMATFAGLRPEQEPGVTSGTRAMAPMEIPDVLVARSAHTSSKRVSRRLAVLVSIVFGIFVTLGVVIYWLGREQPASAMRPSLLVEQPAQTVAQAATQLDSHSAPKTEPPAAKPKSPVAVASPTQPVTPQVSTPAPKAEPPVAKPKSPVAVAPAAQPVTSVVSKPAPKVEPPVAKSESPVAVAPPAQPVTPVVSKPAPKVEPPAAEPKSPIAVAPPTQPVTSVVSKPAPKVEPPAAEPKSPIAVAPPTQPVTSVVSKPAPKVEPKGASPAPKVEPMMPDPAAVRAKELAEATAQLAKSQQKLTQGGLKSCDEVMGELAKIPSTLHNDASLKQKWDALREACATLLKHVLEQHDPIDQRAMRLQRVAQILSLEPTSRVLGAEAKTFKQMLDQQQRVCLLRLVNRGNQPIQVSARELPEKASLAGGEVKEWLIPVSGESLTVSLSVDWGSRFRSQMETFKLPRSGGIERMIGKTAPVVVTPEPATKQAVTPIPASPQSPNTTPPPSQPVTEAVAATQSVHSEKAFFQISVVPKIGILMVDGKVVEAGKVEVTPSENHKVEAVCQGYKSLEQYYKVKPGETRKIDLMLEKEVKRSLFGF